ncbi:MAG: DUF6273 domain-containing protein [Treponema sp.]|uniref:DUF6273 domain-containing protein n=1 Tax=Treponema sp. TaxID=166 RepID=UPI00298E5022|nr:DUF6273 domain-containing protein [Treponema sp.]MCR5386889.1 DUF6273 domain-containing protein [Treponema sp.]
MKKMWFVLMIGLSLLTIFSACSSAVNSKIDSNAEQKNEMAFVLQLPDSNARVAYYTQDDATSYKVELLKAESVIKMVTGLPGEKVRFVVTEEGSYTINVTAYKDSTVIAEATKDASITFADGEIDIIITMVPKAKEADLNIIIQWPTGSSGGTSLYTKVGTKTIGNTTYDIVEFGKFPQSEKTDDSVIVDESESMTVGFELYYKGSDNEWYTKLNSKYYKVEPIKWRVLTTDYNGTGKKLLLAEDILINCKYFDYIENRTDGSVTVYPNNYEYSRIRAYLNGLSYQKNSSTLITKHLDKGFLQTAFTTEEQAAIAKTTVVNNARSTNPDGDDYATLWNGGYNRFASDSATNDKIFLLSEQEVTKADYGFDVYNASGTDSSRIRKPTHFAATRVSYSTSSGYEGNGFWLLRSPTQDNSLNARSVYVDGSADFNYYADIEDAGVVPALCLD